MGSCPPRKISGGQNYVFAYTYTVSPGTLVMCLLSGLGPLVWLGLLSRLGVPVWAWGLPFGLDTPFGLGASRMG